MTPTLTVLLKASAQGYPIDIDEDCVLAGAQGYASGVTAQWMLSTDSTLTLNSVTGPSTNQLIESMIAFGDSLRFLQLNIPLQRGSRIFATTGSAGFVQLYFNLIR